MKTLGLLRILSLVGIFFFLRPPDAAAACGVTTRSITSHTPPLVYMNITNSGFCTLLDVLVGVTSTSDQPSSPPIRGTNADTKGWFLIETISASLYYHPGSGFYTSMTHCLDTTFDWWYWAGSGPFDILKFPLGELCYIPDAH
jgi:hypothetical protein